MARAETPGEVTMESILSQEQSSCPDIQDELLRILKYPLYKIVWSRIEEFILNHYVGGR